MRLRKALWSSESVGKKGAIPDVGESTPETGFTARMIKENVKRRILTINKNKEILRRHPKTRMARILHYRNPWTHSDRRLSQVRERGGRGLLKDECWSFPPASEREARMDDPTHRSKKDR